MESPETTPEYWEQRWKESQTGWDIGYPSTPIKEYFEQVNNKDIKILIPGCGNAWEGELLNSMGFTQVYMIDIAPTAVEHIKDRIPQLPEDRIILGDFFELEEQFDIIVEQTFFCALNPEKRMDYAMKAHELLKPGGKLVGLLFDCHFGNPHPPFGGTKQEYLTYFEAMFDIEVMDRAYNSIKPRLGRELFVRLRKP